MSGADAGQVITEAGAVLAAVFGGLTWFQSRKHEQTRWTRAALEETFVGFVTAYYDSVDACKQIGLLRKGEQGHKSEEEWMAEAHAADAVVTRTITRLRVLASDEIADLARQLHARNEMEFDLLARGDLPRSLDQSARPGTSYTCSCATSSSMRLSAA